ncbi:SDR family oxidoreductase [Nafulsella turpanensis]|uniref:SDR family oxidoreductase n=1 Tax=Nafulsella turpanensis TaxID=1265690 RepID=UPI00034A72EB|nr:SDR family oxidoreductase [Nafulsella turpanensis]
MEIKDARVIVTGGSSGIGYATAQKLAERGARVLITGRNKEKLERAAEEIGAIPVVADVAREEEVEATFRAVREELGGLDVLINNAGIARRKSIEELTVEDFEAVYRTNVFGAAMMAKHAASIFKEQNSGHIVNIASTAAKKGYATGTIYCGSKFALRGMTECWQAELRPHNVRVILVNPSEVTTAFGQPDRKERPEEPNKLRSEEIAHTIVATLEMDDRGFIPEVTVFATNPFKK